MNSRRYGYLAGRRLTLSMVWAVGTWALCAGCSEEKPAPARVTVDRLAKRVAGMPRCPAEAPAPPVLPHQRPAHSLVDFWLVAMAKPAQVLMSLDEIRDHVRADLPAWNAPKELVVVDALPKTALGKIRKSDLL